MPGIPSRTFELEIAPLIPKAADRRSGRTTSRRNSRSCSSPKRFEALLDKSIVPLGLRWRVTPAMGLPRAPFSVFRRLRKRTIRSTCPFPRRRSTTCTSAAASSTCRPTPLYVLLIRVRNTHPTAAVTVQRARSRESSAAAADRAGAGQLAAARPLPASVYRRILLPRRHVHDHERGRRDNEGVDRARKEWELIEVVGLPGKPARSPATTRSSRAIRPQLEEPPDAALRRIEIGQQFYEDLATSLPSGVTVPLLGDSHARRGARRTARRHAVAGRAAQRDVPGHRQRRRADAGGVPHRSSRCRGSVSPSFRDR